MKERKRRKVGECHGKGASDGKSIKKCEERRGEKGEKTQSCHLGTKTLNEQSEQSVVKSKESYQDEQTEERRKEGAENKKREEKLKEGT